jgi:hypothetical protein
MAIKIYDQMKFQDIVYEDIQKLGKLQPDGWTDIIPDFEFYVKSDFCIPIKATFDNQIVGVGVSILYHRTCWLAHIIVDENHRNRGIGSQITHALLNHPGCKSVDTFLLFATEMGFPIYRRAGFRSVDEYTFLERDKPWRDVQISPAIVPYDHDFYSGIMMLDHEITGEERSNLLSGFLQNTVVYINKSAVEGFFMPELREGLIIAGTAGAGLELMKVKYSRSDKAVIPEENKTGIDFLLKNGFIVTSKKVTRMVKGNDIPWMPQNIYSRIGGNFG